MSAGLSVGSSSVGAQLSQAQLSVYQVIVIKIILSEKKYFSRMLKHELK
jgi:hypothetical protein